MCGAGDIWKISVSSPKFCYAAKTVSKKTSLNKRMHAKQKERKYDFKDLESKGNL